MNCGSWNNFSQLLLTVIMPDTSSSPSTDPNTEIAAIFQELNAAEKTADALEGRLSTLERRLDELLRQLEEEEKAVEQEAKS
jgi:ubiquinone biosynthesis protein UbiJ